MCDSYWLFQLVAFDSHIHPLNRLSDLVNGDEYKIITNEKLFVVDAYCEDMR